MGGDSFYNRTVGSVLPVEDNHGKEFFISKNEYRWFPFDISINAVVELNGAPSFLSITDTPFRLLYHTYPRKQHPQIHEQDSTDPLPRNRFVEELGLC